MSFISLLLAVLSLQWHAALALSPQFIDCQLQKAANVSPLSGCPQGTIFVSQTDRRAAFTSIQAAIESLYAPSFFLLSSFAAKQT